ncbi:MAG TPA: CdaR family protein [bacterium]|nr:CdaR family protein [bacterium]
MNPRERLLYILLSLGVATVAWYYVATAQNPLVERALTVDLHVRGLSPNEVLVQAPPPTVRVRLSGSRTAVFGQLSPAQVDASIDLAGQRPGEHRVQVVLTTPPEVRAVAQTPEEVLVVLDTVATRRFPVEISLIGNLPQGVNLGPPRVTPAFVTVTGAATQIDEIRHAIVTVDTSNLPQQAATSLQVRLLDANDQEVRGPTIDPPIVTAQLTVKESVIAKVVPVVPAIAGAPPAPLAVTAISTDPATVTLQGPSLLLQGVTAVSTAPVDLRAAKGDLRQQVPLQIPSGASASVSRVTVSVKLGGGSLSTIFRSVPVQVVGLRRGVRPRVVPSSIDVQVEGPTNVVARLTPASIRIVVDAGGRGAGRYQVTPQAQLPQGVRVLNLRPTQVLVILTAS